MTSSLREIRQQLDDLNALMSRLMALPVVPDPGGEPQPPTEAAEPPPVQAPPTVSDALIETPPSPLQIEPSPAAQAIAAVLAPVDPAPDFLTEYAPSALAPGPDLSRRERLIAFVNRQFDRLCLGLGPLGRLLAAPASTKLLGRLGVAMLAAAPAWAVLIRYGPDWLAWAGFVK